MPEEVKRSTLQRFKGLPNRWNLNGFHCLGISRHPSKIKDKLLYLAPPATEEEQCWVACFMLQKQYIPYLSIISVSFIMWNRSFEWSLEQEDTLLQGQATVKATLPLPPCNLTALVVPKITYLWGRKKLGGPAMHPSRKFAAQNKGQFLTCPPRQDSPRSFANCPGKLSIFLCTCYFLCLKYSFLTHLGSRLHVCLHTALLWVRNGLYLILQSSTPHPTLYSSFSALFFPREFNVTHYILHLSVFLHVIPIRA